MIDRRLRTIFTPHRLQAGFRHSFSTLDHHASFQSHITNGSGNHISSVFLDLSKAFDRVWINALLYKLRQLGIRGRMYRFLRCFLTNRFIRVVYHSTYSIWFLITAGVPQGAVLSPLLFVIFIDDLPRSIPTSPSSHLPRFRMWLFADDIAVSGYNYGITGDHQLRRALVFVWDWCQVWLCILNFDKCISVIFSRQHTAPPSLTFYLDGRNRKKEMVDGGSVDVVKSQPIKQSETFNYLGLNYSSNLSWSHHANIILNKVAIATGRITRIITPSTPIFIIRLLLLTLVVPIFSYGFPFWSPSSGVCKRFIRIISTPLLRALTLPHSTHRLSLLTECGILHPSILFQRSVLLFNRHSRLLPPDHPSFNLFTNWPWNNLLSRVRSDLVVNDGGMDLVKIKNAAGKAHLKLWRSDKRCKDLITLRPNAHFDVTHYIRHDLPHHSRIRARLRLNRSYLASSRFRRHFSNISSPNCSICKTPETVQHLLTCPRYIQARSTLHSSLPFIRSLDSRLLLGEIPAHFSKHPSTRDRILLATGDFITSVSKTLPSGL